MVNNAKLAQIKYVDFAQCCKQDFLSLKDSLKNKVVLNDKGSIKKFKKFRERKFLAFEKHFYVFIKEKLPLVRII